MSRSLPLILTLDQHGVPHRWVTWQQAVWYYAKERVAWELGREAFTVWGGRCHRTGERSSITANSIIAIRGKALAIRGFNAVPPLNNRELFNRDQWGEQSILVFEARERQLIPAMQAVEAQFKGIKVFSLPSMGADGSRIHVELGVRGAPAQVGPAMEILRCFVRDGGFPYQ